MFRPHKIKWSDYRSKIVPDAKKQPIRHSQMERLVQRDKHYADKRTLSLSQHHRLSLSRQGASE